MPVGFVHLLSTISQLSLYKDVIEFILLMFNAIWRLDGLPQQERHLHVPHVLQ